MHFRFTPRNSTRALVAANLVSITALAGAQQNLPEVQVIGTRSAPPAISRETPAVTESIEREQITQSINASDAEDVLK